MDKTKVCANCRKPLGYYQSRYCERCAPYCYRALSRTRHILRQKRKTNPFFTSPISGCKVCGKIKYKSEFYPQLGYATCKACKNELRKKAYTPRPPREKKKPAPRLCECGTELRKGQRSCSTCVKRRGLERARARMRNVRASGKKSKPVRSLEAKRRRSSKNKDRRAHLKRNLLYSLTEEQWQDTLSRFDNKCAYCGSPWEHKDHFIPMSKRGGYTRDNIVPACATCNSALKGDKLPGEFVGNIQAYKIAHTLGVH